MKRIKVVFQRDSRSCGVACLSMILQYYGKKVNSSYLNDVLPCNREGVSAFSIIEAANKLGLKGEGLKTDIKNLQKIKLPVILHWNLNHFVVLYNINDRCTKFWIADPAKGKYKISDIELKKHWLSEDKYSTQGVVLSFEPSNIFTKNFNENKNSISAFKFLFKYIKNYKKHFYNILLGLGLGCILQLILPFLTQAIVDLGIKHEDLSLIWLILLGEFLIVIGKTITDFIRRWLLLHISVHVNISLVSDFFIKLLKLPMAFFDTKLMGDLFQRINDHERIQNFLTSQILNIILSLLTFIIFSIVLFIYSSQIFGVFIIGSILYGLWLAIFLHKRRIIDTELFGRWSKNHNKVYQILTSIQEIKLQNCEIRRRWEWEDSQADLFRVQMQALKLQQKQEAGSVFINELKNIIITVLAATSVIKGEITLGEMLAIQYIIGQLNSPVEQFMLLAYTMQDVKLSLERILEIHESRDEDTRNGIIYSFSNTTSIQIKNIFFKYNIHSLFYTLNNININIPAGEVTAIVGASGSGKSTLIKLLLGYYTVESGKILIGENEIHKYNLSSWRKQCGVVMQDGVIFSDTIAHNIAIQDSEIDKERLDKAIEIANLNEFILNLPLKYDTQIGSEGITLSQGQKQRILIARAVYKNPKFIFLDEATNSLDANNEQIIIENLNNFYKGKTVVVVAHRLSTVINANQIIVMDGGKVVENGSHASLIEKKGYYYRLIKNQLELGN